MQFAATALGGLGMKSYLKGWQTVFTLLKCSQRQRVAENVLCKHPFSSIIPTHGGTQHVSTKLFVETRYNGKTKNFNIFQFF